MFQVEREGFAFPIAIDFQRLLFIQTFIQVVCLVKTTG